MASGALRRTVQLSLSLINKRQRTVQLDRLRCRKFSTSIVYAQKYFSEKHEWIDVAECGTKGTVGITDYAQDKLGEVVYVQLPEIGQEVEADGDVGVLESVKAASDVYSPVSGEVTEINDQLPDNPKLINESPLENGWLYKMTLTNPSELEELMNDQQYSEFIENEG